MKQLILLIATTSFLAATALAQAPFNVHDNIGAGNCLEFDGMDDIVDFGDINDATFDGVNQTLTVEMWIRPTDLTTDRNTIMSKYNNGIIPRDRIFIGRV